jgi:hypothetical protein
MNDRSIQRTSTQPVPPMNEFAAATDAAVVGGPRDVQRLNRDAETEATAKVDERMKVTELRKNDAPQLLADFVDPGSGTRGGA